MSCLQSFEQPHDQGEHAPGKQALVLKILIPAQQGFACLDAGTCLVLGLLLWCKYVHSTILVKVLQPCIVVLWWLKCPRPCRLAVLNTRRVQCMSSLMLCSSCLLMDAAGNVLDVIWLRGNRVGSANSTCSQAWRHACRCHGPCLPWPYLPSQ